MMGMVTIVAMCGFTYMTLVHGLRGVLTLMGKLKVTILDGQFLCQVMALW